MNLQEKIKVMQVFDSGQLIEYKLATQGDEGWRLCPLPQWDWCGFDYRAVKPVGAILQSQEDRLDNLEERMVAVEDDWDSVLELFCKITERTNN